MSTSANSDWELWAYRPSMIGGAVAAVVFAVLFILHTFRLIRTRTWFCIPIALGAQFETIGYAARAAAHNDTESTIPYIIQSVLILVAPILFAASIYMVLGRLIRRTSSDSYSIIHPNWVTKIFVVGDVICFFIQGAGAGLLVQADDDAGAERGEDVILAGLILQIVIFGFFVVVAAIWHKRLAALPTAAAVKLPWKKYAYCLYAASLCITIRNGCRVVEYAMGRDGYLLSHEWPLYVYDCVPMVIVLIICLIWYNASIKPLSSREIELERSV